MRDHTRHDLVSRASEASRRRAVHGSLTGSLHALPRAGVSRVPDHFGGTTSE